MRTASPLNTGLKAALTYESQNLLLIYIIVLLTCQVYELKQQIINKLRGFFSLQPIEKAWVFGSCSRGEETKDSDIDILVRFDSHARITLFKYAGMVEALSQLLHRKVDLVEEGQLKDFAVSSVDRDKILIYEREA